MTGSLKPAFQIPEMPEKRQSRFRKLQEAPPIETFLNKNTRID